MTLDMAIVMVLVILMIVVWELPVLRVWVHLRRIERILHEILSRVERYPL